MDIQDIAYAVSRPAFIIDIPVPHGLSGQNIQVSPRTAIKESGVRQLQHSCRYRSEMFFYLSGNRAKHDGSCHICGSAHILSAGIHQQHSFLRKLLAAAFHSLIMHHSRIFLIAAYRGEGKIQITVNFTPQMIQVLCRRHLCYFHFSHVFLKPVYELTYRGTVLQIDLLHMCEFHLILNGLHQLRGILTVLTLPFFTKGAIKSVAGIVSVIEDFLSFRPALKEGNYVIIVFERYAIFRSMCPEFRRYFRILDKEKAFLHGNISVRKSNGIAFHIAAPDIKQPHQIIQLAEEESIGLFLLHGLPDIFQLFSGAFSAYRLIQHHDRMAGKRRSVRPNLICQIFSIGKRNFLFLKDFF